MTEILSYEGESGLLAIVQVLDALRLRLHAAEIEPQQAAGYLGCINMHLALTIGVSGGFLEHLESCGGLLCPACKAFIGFISDLSGHCHRCGARLFPQVDEQPKAATEA